MRALYRLGHLPDYQHVLKQAIKTNLSLITKDNFKQLFKLILNEDVFIEEEQVFILFLTACLQAHNKENLLYA